MIFSELVAVGKLIKLVKDWQTKRGAEKLQQKMLKLHQYGVKKEKA